MSKWIKKFWNDEQGLELSEYAIMAALVIILAIGVITTLGNNIQRIFSALGSKVGDAADTAGV